MGGRTASAGAGTRARRSTGRRWKARARRRLWRRCGRCCMLAGVRRRIMLERPPLPWPWLPLLVPTVPMVAMVATATAMWLTSLWKLLPCLPCRAPRWCLSPSLPAPMPTPSPPRSRRPASPRCPWAPRCLWRLVDHSVAFAVSVHHLIVPSRSHPPRNVVALVCKRWQILGLHHGALVRCEGRGVPEPRVRSRRPPLVVERRGR